MRKSVSETSFLDKKERLSIEKTFISSSASYFPTPSTIKNTLLTKLLRQADAELVIASTNTKSGERVLCEKLKKAGLLYDYGEGSLFNDYPKFNYAGLFFHVDREHSEEIQTAWGYSLPHHNSELALSKALGEVLERQASYFTTENKLAIFPKLTSGDASHLYPYIPKSTPAQQQHDPLLVKDAKGMKEILGFKAKSLTGGPKQFFPFEAFYWGHTAAPEQKIFQHATTSGSGGGKTVTEAILAGTLELIERDLVMLYWLSKVPALIIDNATIKGPTGDYVRNCGERYNLEVYFLSLKFDIDVTTIVCVVIDPILHRVTMGAKSSFKVETAIEGSLLEALAVLSTTRSKDEMWTEEELKELLAKESYSPIVSRKARVNMYSNSYGVGLIRQTLLTGRKVPIDDVVCPDLEDRSFEDRLDFLLNELKRLVGDKGPGYHAYVHEFKSSWLKELDYRAVHVYIPSLMKLHLNERYAAPISERLYEFAKINGRPNFRASDINELPHLFP